MPALARLRSRASAGPTTAPGRSRRRRPVAGIHVFLFWAAKTWMAGTSPAMTTDGGWPGLPVLLLDEECRVGKRQRAHPLTTADRWWARRYAPLPTLHTEFALFVEPVDEDREGLEILLQHLLQRFLDEFALVIEGIANAIQIGLRLSHDRTGNARQDVLQMLGRADAAERSGRVGDDPGRLAEKRALAVGARANVDGVLEHAGDRAVVFGGHEQHGVRRLQLFAESQPVGRRRRL